MAKASITKDTQEQACIRRHLRAHLLQSAEDQSQPDIRRPDRRNQQTDERIWLVSFMDYDLGYFDDETCRLEPLANPFGPKALPMSSV